MDDTIENTFAPVFTEKENESLGLFALYTTRVEAENAVKTLEQSGFLNDTVSLLAPSRSGHHDFIYRQSSSLLQGAAIGAVSGAVLLALGSVFVQGTMWSAFIGGLVGLVFGAAAGALAGIGSPKSAAKRYGFYLKEGGIVLVIHLQRAADREKIERILEQTKGQDITLLDESKIWSTIIPEKKKLLFLQN